MQHRKLATLCLATFLCLSGANIRASAATPAAAAASAPAASAASASSPKVVEKNTAPSVLSSAKTVRELIEIDDKIALKKERAALLLEQAKDGDLDPATKKSADAALSAQATRAAAEALKKEAAAAASVIKVNAIIGIEGRRVVQGSIGGRTMAMNEGSGAEKHGWKLTSIHGHCADFEKLASAQDSAQKPAGSSKKRATQSGNQSDEKLTAKPQTSCFSLAAAAPTTMQAGSTGAQRTVPVPVPLPGFASTPQPFTK